MNQRYGNQVYGAIASNWGPSNTDRWVQNGAHWDQLPTETQNHLGRLAVESARQGGSVAPQPSPQPQAAPPGPVQAQSPAQAPRAAPGGPTPQQIDLIKEMLSNPQTHEQGLAYAQKVREDLANPTKYDIQNFNGLPGAVDPHHPEAGAQMIPLPQAAMTHNLSAEQVAKEGYGPGSVVQAKPTGEETLIQKGDEDNIPLSDEAVSAIAAQYVATGNQGLPPLGMGKAAASNRDRILNKAAEIYKATGSTGPDAVVRWATIHSAQQGLTQATKLRSAVEGFENTALKSADLALSLAPKGVGPTGRPVFDQWLQAGRKATGDPNVTNFQNALGTFADEYARVVSGGTGNVAATDSARHTAYSRFNSAMNMQQLQDALNVMRQEMAFRTQALRGQEGGLQDTIRTNANPAAASQQKVRKYNPQIGRIE